jgi:hypothetical protein
VTVPSSDARPPASLGAGRAARAPVSEGEHDAGLDCGAPASTAAVFSSASDEAGAEQGACSSSSSPFFFCISAATSAVSCASAGIADIAARGAWGA